jgi:hypothetical protein
VVVDISDTTAQPVKLFLGKGGNGGLTTQN